MQQIKTSKESPDYQQSQQASRGEFSLSPWESQLINDAQFTANTTLPSIPFDVNDDYVAQQLGQRVGE